MLYLMLEVVLILCRQCQCHLCAFEHPCLWVRCMHIHMQDLDKYLFVVMDEPGFRSVYWFGLLRWSAMHNGGYESFLLPVSRRAKAQKSSIFMRLNHFALCFQSSRRFSSFEVLPCPGKERSGWISLGHSSVNHISNLYVLEWNFIRKF